MSDHRSRKEKDTYDSQLKDLKHKYNKRLKDGEFKVRTSDSSYRCPFCDGKDDYSFREIIRHADRIGRGSRRKGLRETGQHLALSFYVGKYLRPKHASHSASKSASGRPCKDSAANIPTKVRDGMGLTKGGSRIKDGPRSPSKPDSLPELSGDRHKLVTPCPGVTESGSNTKSDHVTPKNGSVSRSAGQSDTTSLPSDDDQRKFVWPCMGIVANIPTPVEKGRRVGQSGSKMRDELTTKGYNPVRVQPLWNDHVHSGFSLVEFRKDWEGYKNALMFEKDFKVRGRGRADYYNHRRKDDVYGWFAREDDYNSREIFSHHLKQKGDLRSVSDLTSVSEASRLAQEHQRENEETPQDAKQAVELEIEQLRGALQVLGHMDEDNDPESCWQMEELKEKLDEKMEELEATHELNQTLVIKHKNYEQELEDGRKETNKGILASGQAGRVNIGVKRTREMEQTVREDGICTTNAYQASTPTFLGPTHTPTIPRLRKSAKGYTVPELRVDLGGVTDDIDSLTHGSVIVGLQLPLLKAVLVTGDGMECTMDGEIFDDKAQKVFTLGDRFIIGQSGHEEFDEKIKVYLEKKENVDYLMDNWDGLEGVEYISDVIKAIFAHKVATLPEDEWEGVYFAIIAGVDRHGVKMWEHNGIQLRECEASHHNGLEFPYAADKVLKKFDPFDPSLDKAIELSLRAGFRTALSDPFIGGDFTCTILCNGKFEKLCFPIEDLEKHFGVSVPEFERPIPEGFKPAKSRLRPRRHSDEEIADFLRAIRRKQRKEKGNVWLEQTTLQLGRNLKRKRKM